MSEETDRLPVKQQIRAFIAENYLFGPADAVTDSTSFLEAGILDSTGILQLVAFLGETFHVSVADEDMTPDNLDSIDKVYDYVLRKQNAQPRSAAGSAS
jgi:acyl carrier protein